MKLGERVRRRREGGNVEKDAGRGGNAEYAFCSVLCPAAVPSSTASDARCKMLQKTPALFHPSSHQPLASQPRALRLNGKVPKVAGDAVDPVLDKAMHSLCYVGEPRPSAVGLSWSAPAHFALPPTPHS